MKKKKPIFSQRIIVLRKKKGLTQTQLAESLAISLNLMKYYENGAENPTMEQIKKFAEFFEVTSDELIY